MRSDTAVRAVCWIVIATVCVYAAATSCDADERVDAQTLQFDIRPQSISSALNALALQTHQRILFTPEIAKAKKTQGVKGMLTADAALSQLLVGTGLSYSKSSDGMILVLQVNAKGASASSRTSGATPHAPSSQSQSTQENGRRLEEIIVTARKRQETNLNVPVIETAIPQSQVERMQMVEVSDFPGVVPGLMLGRSLLTIGTFVSIRGVGTSASDQGVDPSVALNIDGLQPGNALALESGIFDLQQVEVLRGPQALFFGKSTPGGVISLRTADPTDKFEVIGRAAYEFESLTPREEAIVSGPITDTLKARLAAMYSTSQGYFYNTGVAAPGTGALTPTNSRAPAGYDYIVRETTLWDPIDQFDARLKLNLVHDYIVDQNLEQLTSCPEGAGFAPAGIPFIGNDNCKISRDIHTVWMDPADFPGILNHGEQFVDTQQEYATLELNYRPIQDLTVTSVTADYQLKSNALVNASGTTNAGATFAAENFFHRRELTEELRVNSDFKSPVNFTAGAFYEDGLITEHVLTLGNAAYHLPAVIQGDTDPVTVETRSAFGQGRWKIVPGLELAVGLRWSDETRIEHPVGVTGLPVLVLQPRVHANNLSPEFTLTYKPTDDVTTYAAWKQGFKSGSFSLSTPVNPVTNNNAFGEETVRGGEVGLKSRLLDRHLTSNLAGYLYNYSGLQVGAIRPAPASGELGLEQGTLQTVNAGAARVYGVDFDTAYRPAQIEGLTIDAALEWNHARYLNLQHIPCWSGQTISQGCDQFLNTATGLYQAQSLNGTPLVRGPAWQVNGGASYEVPLPRDYRMVVSNNNAFSSRYVTVLAIGRPNNDNFAGSYVKADLSLSLQAPNDSWELALIGKNLNDKITTGFCSNAAFAGGLLVSGTTGGATAGPGGAGQQACFVDPGREVWIRLTVRPFATAK